MATTAAGVAADEELIRQAVHGDRDAFAEIYRRYHQVVFRFARMMSGSQTLAEDVTQEVFVSLLKDPGRYDPQRAVLSTYLYGMARNLTRGHLRQRGRFVELSDDAYGRGEAGTSGDQSEVMIAVQTREKLRAVIATLPSRYREAVILCDVHGLSYADAAIVIGRPVGTLRSRLHRARALIEERMLEQPSSLGTLARARCIA